MTSADTPYDSQILNKAMVRSVHAASTQLQAHFKWSWIILNSGSRQHVVLTLLFSNDAALQFEAPGEIQTWEGDLSLLNGCSRPLALHAHAKSQHVICLASLDRYR